MFAKVIRERTGDFDIYEGVSLPEGEPLSARHVSRSSVYDDKGERVGFRVVLHRDSGDSVSVEIPQDGDVVYIENDRGDTVETVHWPPRAVSRLHDWKRRRRSHGKVQTQAGPEALRRP